MPSVCVGKRRYVEGVMANVYNVKMSNYLKSLLFPKGTRAVRLNAVCDLCLA